MATKQKSSRRAATQSSLTGQTQSSRGTATLPGEPNVARVGSMAQASAALNWGGGGWGSGQGYGMADQSSARGFVYFPQLDTRKEVTSYTRGEGLRKARFLDANVGLVRRLLNGMGRMAMGTGLTPNPTTKDKEWNNLMRARLKSVLGSAQTYDLSGRHDFYSAQAPAMTAAYRDGDLGKAYARDEGGNLRVAFYEGHQIGGEVPNAAPIAGTQLFDGVRVDRHNRRLGFVIQSGDQAGQAVEIPATDFALLCAPERFGAPRGVTVLKHCINKLIDRGELEAMTSKGMKNAARVGFALTRDVGAPAKPPGWNGGTGVNPVTTKTVNKADGTTGRVKVEDIQDNTGGEIPELPPGHDIKMLLDTRPHPNTFEFFDYLARDAAMGCDWEHELLYSIWKLGGANMRYVLASAAGTIEREQQRYIDLHGASDYVLFAAEEIRTGRVRKCQDPEWWAHEFIPPQRTTVDFGKDGNLYLEQIKCGALTFRRYFAWQGLGLDQLDQWMDEVAMVNQGCIDRKFSPELTTLVLDGLYRRSGVAASAPVEASPTPDSTQGESP